VLLLLLVCPFLHFVPYLIRELALHSAPPRPAPPLPLVFLFIYSLFHLFLPSFFNSNEILSPHILRFILLVLKLKILFLLFTTLHEESRTGHSPKKHRKEKETFDN
jgi:hypothetical protein